MNNKIIGKSFMSNEFNIYDSFVKYFGDLVMTKIKDVVVGNELLSYYAAEIFCVLGNDRRYVIALVRKDSEMNGTRKGLSSLSWTCLQTRTLSENFGLQKQSYLVRRIPELNHEIVKRKGGADMYDCDKLPNLLTTLLKTSKNEYYVDRGNTIIEAIETYNTIFSFK